MRFHEVRVYSHRINKGGLGSEGVLLKACKGYQELLRAIARAIWGYQLGTYVDVCIYAYNMYICMHIYICTHTYIYIYIY